MCGIAGVIYADPDRPVDEQLIRTLCDAIQHRGPDDSGIFTDGHVGLGMRRLSIIDLEGGHQPVFNENGDVVVVMNGEIYNYRDLRAQLIARGHRLATESDTEVLVHLYEDFGDDLVSHLRGMFAFAIWDRRRHRLLLGRDRFGIKPLYVAQRRWGLAFASELKALVAAGLTDRTVHPEAIDAFLQLGYVPAPMSPFGDVRKLEPAQILSWSRESGPVIRTYWDLPTERRHPTGDAVHEVLAALDESVAAHLVSDVPVAAFLSGGLDSSAVVSSWAAQGLRPTVFTAQYSGTGADATDESPLATALARRYGLELIVVPVRPQIADVFEPIVYALDEPHADDSAIPTWALSEVVARQFKVVLTGIGGDEMFAGYRRHLGLLATAHLSRLPTSARALLRGVIRRIPERGRWEQQIHRLRRFVHSAGDTPGEQFLRMLVRVPNEDRLALLHPDFFGATQPDATLQWFSGLLDSTGESHHGLNAGLYLDYKTFLPDDILALSDRMSMAHSLEVRVPLVDHELVDVVFPLPDRVKAGRFQAKRLLRKALRDRLPPQHFRAPKRGFVGPTAEWLRGELKDMVTDELSADRIRRLGMFDTNVIQRFLHEHLERKRNRETIVWNLLCLSVWHRLYVEGAPGPIA